MQSVFFAQLVQRLAGWRHWHVPSVLQPKPMVAQSGWLAALQLVVLHRPVV
jgi:hypothetical protein